MSLKHRLKPLESQRLDLVRHDRQLEFDELDERLHAREMLHQNAELQEQMNQVENRIHALNRELEHQSDQLQGISLTLNLGNTDTWKVANITSRVQHSAQVSFASSLHNWKTKCGWAVSGKKNAETFCEHATFIHTYKLCPKCHQLPECDESSSS